MYCILSQNRYQFLAEEFFYKIITSTPGQAACIATALGYMSNDGRTFNHEALAKDFDNLPFVARWG
jgi:hypothetical protein